MSKLWRKARTLFGHANFDRDLEDELRFHLESKLEEWDSFSASCCWRHTGRRDGRHASIRWRPCGANRDRSKERNT